MSYLELPDGIPDFDKAVISLWFRVPQASMDAAAAAFTGEDGALLDGIIPLVVMGERGTDQTPYHRRDTQMVEYNIYANYIAGPNYTLNGIASSVDLGGGVTEVTNKQNLDCYWSTLPAAYYPDIIYKEVTQSVSTGDPAPQADPTYIGVDGSGNLYINFQTGKKPQISGWEWDLASITPGKETNAISDYGGLPLGGSTGDPYDSSAFYFVQGTIVTRYGGIYGFQGVTISNDSHHVPAPGGHNIIKPIEHWADVSTVAMDATGIITNDGSQSVTADQWHHLLISIELQTIQAHGLSDPSESYEGPIANYVDSAARLFVALDDVNYTQYDLSSLWVNGAGDNDIITEDAERVAGSSPTTDDQGASLGRPEYSLADPAVISSHSQIGLPGTTEAVDNIYPVEMAEFQMWVGITLDTGIEANRRAFIDADGKPVSPLPPMIDNPNYDPTKPESADNPKLIPDPDGSPAEKLLGKKPEILLHGSGNWISGKNTGPMIDNPDYDPTLPESADNPKLIPDPDKQFTPTGKIVSYTPDPSLHGPQSPTSPPPVRLQRRIRVPA
jgi:hypothetical protein